jgi:hypothetical protein
VGTPLGADRDQTRLPAQRFGLSLSIFRSDAGTLRQGPLLESYDTRDRRFRGIGRAAARWRRKAGEVLRREGLGRVAARASVVAQGTVYRYVVFVAMDLTRPVKEMPPGPALETRLLRPEDVEAYASSRGRSVDSVPALRRLEEGHVCVASWLDGEIVSTAWYAFGSVRVDEIDRLLRLAPDEAYVYDSYTTESLRGLSIAALRGRWAIEHFRGLGFRRTIGWVSPKNLPAFGPARKLGADTLGRAGYLRLGPWRREFVAPADGKRRWAARGEPIVLARDFGLDD